MLPHRPLPSFLAIVMCCGLLLPVFVRSVAAQEDAKALLTAALAEAERTDRLVFLHSGAPWCGWCKRLEHWLQRDDIAPIFFKDFVDLKIDVEEMTGVSACSTGAPPGSATPVFSMSPITHAEIETALAGNAYEAVRLLRPRSRPAIRRHRMAADDPL